MINIKSKHNHRSLLWVVMTVSCLFFQGLHEAYAQGDSAPAKGKMQELITAKAVDMSVESLSDYHYRLSTLGSDPHVLTSALCEDLPSDAEVLTFEYKSVSDLESVQVFFADPVMESRSVQIGFVPASEQWRECSIVLKDLFGVMKWGRKGDYMRLDFGNAAGYNAEIRNIRFREMQADDIAQYQKQQQKIADYVQLAKNLKEYLSHDYVCAVTRVEAGLDAITVRGEIHGNGDFSLCELAPYDDVSQAAPSHHKIGSASSSFTKTFDRYVERDGLLYDRTLSRWIIVCENGMKHRPVSHARYSDHITPLQQTHPQVTASKKGIGDVYDNELLIKDLDDLGITSATVNIRITTFMFSQPGQGRIEHTYGGVKYYFDRKHLSALDRSLIACRDRNIVVGAIILINSAASSVDPQIGALLQHPDYTSVGNYSMPNMTNPQSVNAYAAALDFLADRYSRPDKRHGRIHHWIMHNEVDSGLEWTNMGPNKPVNLYMDTYVKSMRLCHNIVQRYDSHAQVMASHTHAWAVADNRNTYATLDMLNILNDYCRAEGDFRWGLAFHCYPHSLYEPKTWLDQKALYTQDTPIITYKNLEVLDRWIKLPENCYKGAQKRLLWLSENGTNSPSYSAKDMQEQAAGFAWGWKKIAALSGIDAHQWHNWADHEQEYGLRIGLRKFTKDEKAKKESWYAYQAAGTNSEDSVFMKYLPVIGIDNWNIIQPIE